MMSNKPDRKHPLFELIELMIRALVQLSKENNPNTALAIVAVVALATTFLMSLNFWVMKSSKPLPPVTEQVEKP